MTIAPDLPLEPVPTDTGLTPHDWGDKPWKSAFLIALSRTGNVSTACRHVGMARSWVYEEKHNDAVFSEAWREALVVSVELLEQIAYTRATTGVPRRIVRTRTKRDQAGNVIEIEETVEESTRLSDALLRDQLRAAKPEVYGDRSTIRHVGPDEGPVQVEVGPRVRTAERLVELLAIAQQDGLLPRPVGELPVVIGNGSP